MGISVQEISDAAISALRAANYQESSVYENTKLFKRLRKYAESMGQVNYTTELGEGFRSAQSGERTKSYCRHSLQLKNRCVEMFNEYLVTGVIDLRVRKESRIAAPATTHFYQVHRHYLNTLCSDGKQPETIASFRNVICKYLETLETHGITSLGDATAETVNIFLSEIRETWAEGSLRTALSALRSFFKHTGDTVLLNAANRVRPIRTHKITPMLTDLEERSLCEALRSNSTISFRDKAIVLLSLLTGMRACDIVNLRMQDIDWRIDIITIVQRKTGNPLSIPLLPALGNAIVDYIAFERPASGSTALFLRKKAPHGPLYGHTSCYAIVRLAMLAAGISLDEKYCGTRLLRHNAASKMLRAEAPIGIISAVLGHSDPDSTDIYLAVDDARMRECCLPVPGDPIDWEGGK
jgi:integrase